MKTKYLFLLFVIPLLSLCKKQDEWLNKKANKSDVVPTTLADFQLVMNNTNVMNTGYGAYGTISSDNFHITYANWLSAYDNSERNAYIWAKEVYEGGNSNDWNECYQRIGFANIVLDGIEKIPTTTDNQIEKNTLRGTALFFRALNFFELLETFAKPYDKSTANTDLGIVLRLTSDVNVKSTRATIQQGYEQVLTDLTQAHTLLPNLPQFKTQPSKIAANGLLSRVYLYMGEYGKAHTQANLALIAYNTLIDYNTLSTSAPLPFPSFQSDNKEVIFYITASNWGSVSYSILRVDQDLYDQYEANDLRKTVFYVNNGASGIQYKGNYAGINSGEQFCGVSTNELYLIRAEAAVRINDIDAALIDLNTLLKMRWNKDASYTPFSTTNQEVALTKIIAERRKELPFFGSRRWQDLRRLNKDTRFSKILTRSLNNVTYTLPPNDPRYVYAIPDIEVRLSGVPQNPR